MTKLHRAVAAAAILLALGGAGACSATPDTPAAPAIGTGLGAQPQPYDIFLGDKLALVEFASLKLRDDCLQAAGYHQTVQQGNGRQPRNPWAVLRVSRASFGLPSEEVARRSGFGQDIAAEPPPLLSFDPSFDRALDHCTKEAWSRLGSAARNLDARYTDLGNKLLSALAVVRSAPWPAAMATDMADCMTGQGFAPVDRAAWTDQHTIQGFGVTFGRLLGDDNPQWTPKRMPGTVEVGPPVAARKYVPTAEESKLAVAWYQCDRQHGLAAGIFDRALAAERVTVDQHEAEFLELNPALEQLARDATAMVGR